MKIIKPFVIKGAYDKDIYGISMLYLKMKLIMKSLFVDMLEQYSLYTLKIKSVFYFSIPFIYYLEIEINNVILEKKNADFAFHSLYKYIAFIHP